MKKIFSIVLLAVGATIVHAQSFLIIGDSAFYANGISPDGKYVVGQIEKGTVVGGHHTFVWTEEDGPQHWDEDKANHFQEGSTARAVSPTGRIIGAAPDATRMVNTPETPDTGVRVPFITAAYRDYNSETWHILPLRENVNPPFYGFCNLAYAVSDDGKIIVGGQTPGGQAQRWSAGYWEINDDNPVVYHELLPAAIGNEMRAISGDGKVLGGSENYHPTLWFYNNNNYIKKSIAGASDGAIQGVSHNGKYAVFRQNLKAAVYDIDKEEITAFDLGDTYSIPTAVSDNGVVVGYWRQMRSTNVFYERAFIYSKTLGMVNFETFLNDRGIATDMDSILWATGITADGRKVTGYGMRQGKAVSFLAEIPEISNKFVPVKNASIHSPTYGTVVLNWEKPDSSEGNEDVATLTGYKIYKDNVPVETITNPETTSYTATGVADGTYIYTVSAVYDDAGTTVESIASKILPLTMGKKPLPFFDDFSAYQPGGAVFEVMDVLEEIPLSTGYWDVTARTRPFSESWKVSQYGNRPWSAGFTVPGGGEYDESLISPYFDASGFENLLLSFDVRIPQSNQQNSNEKLAIEIHDGSQWTAIDTLLANGRNLFTTRNYAVDSLAGKDNIRFRFRCFGSGAADLRWLIDNVELLDSAHMVTVERPLAISARKVNGDETVHINWSDPYGNVSLRYLLFDNATGYLGNDKYPMIAANMYPAEDLKAYKDYLLTSISFWRTTNPDPAAPMREPKYKWFVSQGGQRLFEEEVENPQIRWNTIQLENPIPIDVDQPLYYGVEIVECDPQDTPIGSATYYIPDPENEMYYLDTTIADGRGNLYSEDDGATWHRISENEGFPYDLYCIRATLAKDPTLAPPRRILGYKIFRNDVNLIDLIWGQNSSSFVMNNYTDVDPLPNGVEACYTVKTQYAYYTGSVLSEGATDCLTVNGIQLTKDENGFSIYPNPLRKGESITIELPADLKNPVLRIYDISGKKVQEIKAQDTIIPLQLNIDPGVYVLKVNDKEAIKLIVK